MATAGGCGGGDDGAGTGSASSFGTAVQFDSESGRIISADFAAPAGVQNPPGILLLHQFGGSRTQWAAFAPQLTAAGYAVLAPDLDYSAINSCPNGDAGNQCRADTVQGLVADVRGGLLYLESRPSLDTSRIAVVGASFGGNLAYVASGEFADVDTAVALSPNANPPSPALLGQGLEDFKPHSILFMADGNEAGDARGLAANTGQPVDVKVYEAQKAHGVELLEEPQPPQDLLAWLAGHLK